MAKVTSDFRFNLSETTSKYVEHARIREGLWMPLTRTVASKLDLVGYQD